MIIIVVDVDDDFGIGMDYLESVWNRHMHSWDVLGEVYGKSKKFMLH